MKLTATFLASIGFLFGALFLGVPASSKTRSGKNIDGAPAPSPGLFKGSAPKYALLVGVNTYKAGSGITNLTGTHNDVALMKSLLKEYGFEEGVKSGTPPASAPCGEQLPSSGIRTLCSEQATKKAILDTFDSHLIKNAADYWKGKTPDPASGPTIVFFYSGHGSQVPDSRLIEGETKALFDEPDGLDETLVPHDSDTKGSRDIRDDSFESRIGELKKYTQNITFISDSCHSGTITRGAGQKGFKRDFPDLKPPAPGSLAGDGRDNMVADPGYVTISGSEPTQFSYEIGLPNPDGSEQPNGLLTYYFVHLVRQNPGASYSDIIRLTRNAIATQRGGLQTPQVEGAVDRAVFGSAASAGKKAIAIKCTGTGTSTVCSEKAERTDEKGAKTIVHKIEIDAGQVIGARDGGPIVIYAPDAKELAGDQGKIAVGNITLAKAFSSEAEVVLSDATAAGLPARAKVVLLAPGFGDGKTTVAIDTSGAAGDKGAASMRALMTGLKDSHSLAAREMPGLLARLDAQPKGGPPPEPVDWDVAVIRGTYRDFKVGREAHAAAAAAKSAPPADDEEGYFITDGNGLALYDFFVRADSPSAAADLRTALENHIWARNLRAMANEATELKGALDVKLVRHKSVQQVSAGRCQTTPFSPEELQKMAGGAPRISRSEAFHLEITNRSTRPLKIYIFSIDSASAVGLLYPNRGAGETLTPGMTFVTNRNACETYNFDPTAPLGSEMVKIIALDGNQELQTSFIERPGIKGVRGAESPIAQMLVQAGGHRGPNSGLGGNVGDWATVDVNYSVVP